MKNSENYMLLEFPSRSVNESFARTAVACFAARLDPTVEELGDIKTAVSEAVTNCIVHAYPNEIGKISIRCRILQERTLEIRVQDRGKGIDDLQAALQPMFTTGSEERSGMGFAIMESMTDSLTVRSKRGRGTTVTMRIKVGVKSDT